MAGGGGGRGGATAPLAPSLSEILNILLHCRKFLEKLQLIVVVEKLQLIEKIMSLAAPPKIQLLLCP